MVARNLLLVSPPYQVERLLKKLGANLRTARLRRRLTLSQIAAKIGTGVRAVSDAEKGKGSTGIAVYAALLWAFDLMKDFEGVADPGRDEEGQILESARRALRARPVGEINNDF